MSNAPVRVAGNGSAQQAAGQNGSVRQPEQAQGNAGLQAKPTQQPAQAPREFTRALDDGKPALAQAPPTQEKKLVSVIVVDNDEHMRKLAVTVLERRFKDTVRQVLTASNSAEALDILARERDAGIVVTDVNMSWKGEGFDLYATLKRERPDVKVIVMSRMYDDDKMREAGLTPRDILDKPFTAGELQERIRKALDELDASGKPSV